MTTLKWRYLIHLLLPLWLLSWAPSTLAARAIAEVAEVYGDRQNQLIGYAW